MLDIGVTKIAIIGVIALVVVGPERLPGLARTLGALLGRARNYVADVKAEVNRSMDLDALRKMKDSVEDAARDVEQSVQTSVHDFEKTWDDGAGDATVPALSADLHSFPQYQRPNKHWRVKQLATPHWYKARAGVRTKALSGAARVARFRPQKYT